MQMDTKTRIAIDMDKVLADPISKFIKLYQRDFGVKKVQLVFYALV